MQYIFSGIVIRGDGNGKKIGYPTINIDPKDFSSLKKKPVFGVYRGQVTLSRKVYNAGIIIGPFDKNGLLKIEAHLIGYKGNAYGKEVVFEIVKFIRKFKKFKTENELIKQIEKDLEKC
jgi:riboflavin kinase/FMN adenylyltransferase